MQVARSCDQHARAHRKAQVLCNNNNNNNKEVCMVANSGHTGFSLSK